MPFKFFLFYLYMLSTHINHIRCLHMSCSTRTGLVLLPYSARQGFHNDRCFFFLLPLILILLTPFDGRAQEYSYTHYDVKDGLAGTVVYSMCQDKEGFIWFATETGVSRFDGSHFKNFTSKDGLPDNEVIRVFADSKGRVWFNPFKHAICYHYRGKIYNQQNDPVLKRIHLENFITAIFEDGKNNVWFTDAGTIYCLTSLDTLIATPIDSMLHTRSAMKGPLSKMAPSDSGYIFLIKDFYVFTYLNGNSKKYAYLPEVNGGPEELIVNDKFICVRQRYNTVRVISGFYKLDYQYSIPPLSGMSRVNDSVVCLNTTRGAIFLNIVTRKEQNRFLPDKNVSNVFIDGEGSTWLSTFNEGVYRLNSKEFRSIKKVTNSGQKLSVYDLQKFDGSVFAGCNMGYLQIIHDSSVRLISLSEQLKVPVSANISSIRVKDDKLAIGTGPFLLYKTHSSGFSYCGTMGSTKAVTFANDKEIMIATSSGLERVAIPEMVTLERTNVGRTTCVLKQDGLVYFGTLGGLYLLKPDCSIFYFGDTYSVLRGRISALREGPGKTIWVATYGEGIVALKNNRILHQVTTQDGLSSNICRCIAVGDDGVWVGTDKGLNKVLFRNNLIRIIKYAAADGLSSDIINAVLPDGNIIYAGTPEGITYFDETKTVSFSRCDLKLTGIYVGNREMAYSNNLVLQHRDNNVRVEFAGISFKSGGDITYHYRLKGLDNDWKITSQALLEFISLPPGEYELELFAVNKFGVNSDTIRVKWKIKAAFWQRTWFILLCCALMCFVTWFIVTRRNRLRRRKEAMQRVFEQRLQELEQKAMLAQMNPHFIFNCLNSVQEFIIDNDVLNANKYLSNFARLVRQTLDNSFQSAISIDNETQYLTTYLDLEQMRFKNRFRYTINIDKSIVTSQAMIPGMILQPYVENAIRHGIQNKDDHTGRIDITISRQENELVCSISDNGVGRKASQAFKTMYVKHQSRGMQLTQERIDMLNKNLEHKIVVQVEDNTSDAGAATGTTVTIRFPLTRSEEYS